MYFSSDISHVQEKLLNILKYEVKVFYKVTHLQHQTLSVKLEKQNQPVMQKTPQVTHTHSTRVKVSDITCSQV